MSQPPPSSDVRSLLGLLRGNSGSASATGMNSGNLQAGGSSSASLPAATPPSSSQSASAGNTNASAFLALLQPSNKDSATVEAPKSNANSNNSSQMFATLLRSASGTPSQKGHTSSASADTFRSIFTNSNISGTERESATSYFGSVSSNNATTGPVLLRHPSLDSNSLLPPGPLNSSATETVTIAASMTAPVDDSLHRYGSHIPFASEIIANKRHLTSEHIGARLMPPLSRFDLASDENAFWLSEEAPKADTITLVPSVFDFYPGQMITATKEFIAYAVKGNKIRVIQQQNGSRTLLSGHLDNIQDLSFFQGSAQGRLASLSIDGALMVHSIYPGSGTELAADILLTVRGHCPRRFGRLVFHPLDSRALALTTLQNEIILMRLDADSKASAYLDEERDHCLLGQWRDCLVLGQHESPIADLSFSRDGTVLVSGDAHQVCIWRLDAAMGRVHSFKTAAPVSRLFFAPESADSVTADSYLIVAMKENLLVQLWHLPSGKVLHTLSFDSSVAESASAQPAPVLFNALAYDSHLCHLYLSNAARRSLFLVELQLPKAHVHQEWTELDLILSGASEASVGAQFSQLVEWPLLQPVLSMLHVPVTLPEKMSLYCLQTRAIQFLHLPLQLTPAGKLTLLPEITTEKVAFNDVSPSKTVRLNLQVQQIRTSSPSTTGLMSPAQLAPNAAVSEAESAASASAATLSKTRKARKSIDKKANESSPTRGATASSSVSNAATSPSISAAAAPSNANSAALERERHEQVLRVVSQTLTNQQKAMEKLIQKSIQESMQKLEKTLQSSLEQTVEKVLQSTIQSATFTNALNAACQQQFERHLIPAYDQSTQVLFRQLHSTFTQGLDQLWEKKWQPVEASVQSLIKQLEKLPAAVVGAQVNQNASLGSIQSPVLAESLLVQQEIDGFLARRQYGEALFKALSANNLKFVVQLCSRFQPESFFAQMMAESVGQHVLLSLVQQLGFDLTRDVDLKLEWLQETLLHLRVHDPSIAPHVSSVLGDLERQLKDWIARGGASPVQEKSARWVLRLVSSTLMQAS